MICFLFIFAILGSLFCFLDEASAQVVPHIPVPQVRVVPPKIHVRPPQVHVVPPRIHVGAPQVHVAGPHIHLNAPHVHVPTPPVGRPNIAAPHLHLPASRLAGGIAQPLHPPSIGPKALDPNLAASTAMHKGRAINPAVQHVERGNVIANSAPKNSAGSRQPVAKSGMKPADDYGTACNEGGQCAGWGSGSTTPLPIIGGGGKPQHTVAGGSPSNPRSNPEASDNGGNMGSGRQAPPKAPATPAPTLVNNPAVPSGCPVQQCSSIVDEGVDGSGTQFYEVNFKWTPNTPPPPPPTGMHYLNSNMTGCGGGTCTLFVAYNSQPSVPSVPNSAPPAPSQPPAPSRPVAGPPSNTNPTPTVSDGGAIMGSSESGTTPSSPTPVFDPALPPPASGSHPVAVLPPSLVPRGTPVRPVLGPSRLPLASGNPQSPPKAVLPSPGRPPKVIPVPVTHGPTRGGQTNLTTPSIATPGPTSYPPAFFLQPGGTYFVTSYNAAKGGYVLPGGIVIPPNAPHLVTANNWPLGSALVWGDKAGSGQVTASDPATMAIVNQIIAGRQNPTASGSPLPAAPAGSPAAVLPNHGASTQGNTGEANAASKIAHKDTEQSNLTDKNPNRASGSTGNPLAQNPTTPESNSAIQPAAKIVEERKSTAPPASQIKTTAMAAAKETTTVQTCNLCDPWTLTDGHVVSVTSNGETYTGLLLTKNGSFVSFASLPVWSGSTPLNTFTGMVRTSFGYIYYVNGQNTVFGTGSINGGFYANGPGTQIAVSPPTSPSTTVAPAQPVTPVTSPVVPSRPLATPTPVVAPDPTTPAQNLGTQANSTPSNDSNQMIGRPVAPLSIGESAQIALSNLSNGMSSLSSTISGFAGDAFGRGSNSGANDGSTDAGSNSASGPGSFGDEAAFVDSGPGDNLSSSIGNVWNSLSGQAGSFSDYLYTPNSNGITPLQVLGAGIVITGGIVGTGGGLGLLIGYGLIGTGEIVGLSGSMNAKF